MRRIKITPKMTGKLAGISSLNTNPLTNPFCLKMSASQKNVCGSCYSQKMLTSYRKKCVAPWELNGQLLSTEELTPEDFPSVKTKEIFRLSAHGEVINTLMYKNYITFVKKNPDTLFALWTKRKDIIKEKAKMGADNLILIYSTPVLNKLSPVLPKNFDKVFSVYTAKFAFEHDIDINCGKSICVDCMLCYAKDTVQTINEVVKDEQHIYARLRKGCLV